MRYLDLYGGIGGFRLGIEKAMGSFNRSKDTKGEGAKTRGTEKRQRLVSEEREKDSCKERWSSDSINRKSFQRASAFECAGYIDINKYAASIYNYQFKENHHPADINTVKASDIPDFDLLCAGFPCQAFSTAGRRKGFSDSRGLLFFEIIRVLETKKPLYILLENVKGLLNHQEGETFTVILRALGKLGYELQWMVLNSRFFGVPQNRERVFIIGHLTERGTDRPEILPIGEIAAESKGIHGGRIILTQDRSEMRLHKTAGETPSLPSRMGEGGNNVPLVSYTLDANYYKGFDPSHLGQRRQIVGNGRFRRLTPVECERLQGFPDNWTAKGLDQDGNEINISDTQRYMALGNAVTVNVIEAIIGKMAGCI